MPYKDPEKQSEYQLLWIAKKKQDPSKHKKMLETRAKWRAKNKDKIRASRERRKARTAVTVSAWYKTPKGRKHKLKYRRSEKGLEAERRFKAKKFYGKYWESKLLIREVNLILKERENEERIKCR